MTAKECLMMLREIKDVAFATVDEDGEPQVRIIDVMLVDDDKLYFCTARGKDFYSQLTADGRVAVTGMNDKYQMVRLSGEAKKVEGQEEWIDKIFDNNPSMNDIYPGDSRYILEPFCIDNGRLEFFDLGRKPIFRETFDLGETLEAEKGFFISEDCIGCGRCARFCPQKCIDEDSPYRIQQVHCLHCGLCRENCPAGAIKRS